MKIKDLDRQSPQGYLREKDPLSTIQSIVKMKKDNL